MPKKVKAKLMATAKQRGYGKERTKAYVYGTARKIEQQQKRKKGKRK